MTAQIARAPEAAITPWFLTLPWPVSANRYWSTAVIKGRAVTFVSKEAKAYRATAAQIAMAAGLRRPIEGRVAIGVQLFPPRPKDWAKRSAKNPDSWDDDVRCLDLDNTLKVTLDALKGVAFVDDNWVHRIDAERCEPDAHGARVVVLIMPMRRNLVAPDMFGGQTA